MRLVYRNTVFMHSSNVLFQFISDRLQPATSSIDVGRQDHPTTNGYFWRRSGGGVDPPRCTHVGPVRSQSGLDQHRICLEKCFKERCDAFLMLAPRILFSMITVLSILQTGTVQGFIRDLRVRIQSLSTCDIMPMSMMIYQAGTTILPSSSISRIEGIYPKQN